MAKKLRTLAALPEYLGSIPIIHSGSQTSIIPYPGDSVPFSALHRYQAYTGNQAYKGIYAGKTSLYIEIN